MILFAKRFKKERLKKGLTQNQLAEMFNTNKSNISRYEKGYSMPGVKNLTKYADFFDVSLDYLIGRTDIPELHNIPKEMQFLFTSENLKYLKIAYQLKINDISPKSITIFLSFYKALEAELKYSR